MFLKILENFTLQLVNENSALFLNVLTAENGMKFLNFTQTNVKLRDFIKNTDAILPTKMELLKIWNSAGISILYLIGTIFKYYFIKPRLIIKDPYIILQCLFKVVSVIILCRHNKIKKIYLFTQFSSEYTNQLKYTQSNVYL